MFLGHPIYLEPKGEGESSILEKPSSSDRRERARMARPARYE